VRRLVGKGKEVQIEQKMAEVDYEEEAKHKSPRQDQPRYE
jgi:hypothetical protein